MYAHQDNLENGSDLVRDDNGPCNDEDSLGWLFSTWYSQNDEMSVKTQQITDSKTVIRIYQMARVLDKILTQKNIRYWTSSGTTLGIVRHGGLIPWDDDIDICILEEDEEDFISLKPFFNNEGYAIQRSQPYAWKIYPNGDSESDGIDNPNYSHRYPFTDIFVMRKHGSMCRIKSEVGRNAWPQEWYYLSNIESPARGTYGDLQLNCPRNPDEYLDREYGPGWREKAQTHRFCHKTGGIQRTTEWPLQENMFTPAMPFR